MPHAASSAIRAARDGCPYLRSSDGQRACHASRDAVCAAGRVKGHVAGERQVSLCLRRDHSGCPTYLGAQGLDGRRDEWAGGRRRIASTTPVVINAGPPGSAPRGSLALPEPLTRMLRSQRLYQGTVAVLIILALALLAAQVVAPGLEPARPSQPAPAAAPVTTASLPSAGSSLGAVSSAIVTPVPASGDLASAPPASGAPRSGQPAESTPSGAAAPGATQLPPGSYITYTVKQGDTLWSIAVAHDTTIDAICAASGISRSQPLHLGQSLRIPR